MGSYPMDDPMANCNKSHSLHDRWNECRIHFRHGAVVASKVLQRCAEMVKLLVVYDKEAVVESAGMPHLKRRILLVELAMAVSEMGVLSTVATVTFTPQRFADRMSSVTSSQ